MIWKLHKLAVGQSMSNLSFCGRNTVSMSAEFKDYYKTLDVSRDATPPEIKKAFRKLARQHHPDVAKDKVTAEEKFKSINEAYEVLSDAEKRKKYDALGQDWRRQGGPPPGAQWSGGGGAEMPEGFGFEGTGFSDFFEQYFSGGHRYSGNPAKGGFRGGSGRAMRGHDIEGDLMVTIEEAFSGSLRTISLRKTDPATGRTRSDQVQVRIPAGIGEGQRMRVPGHGAEGYGGGAAGDLYLRVRMASHPDFRVLRHDLYRDLTLAPWEAALGITLSIKLPGGKSVQLKIPPGTDSGDQMRLKGYGLPKKNAPGDLYFEIAIASPSTHTETERELWEKLRDASNFNPRKD